MINIDSSQVKEIDYLIEQSIKGNHLIFDNNTIKKYCYKKEEDFFSETDHKDSERLLERFMSTPSIRGKKEFFRDLSNRQKTKLLNIYFSLVSNNIVNIQKLPN